MHFTASRVYVCYRQRVRAVCMNNEVVEFQPWTLTTPVPRISRKCLHLFHSFSLTCSNLVMDIRFFLLPDLTPIAPPTFVRRSRLSISLHPLLPPPPSCPDAEQLSPWVAPQPAGIHRSSLLSSHTGRPKEFLTQAC